MTAKNTTPVSVEVQPVKTVEVDEWRTAEIRIRTMLVPEKAETIDGELQVIPEHTKDILHFKWERKNAGVSAPDTGFRVLTDEQALQLMTEFPTLRDLVKQASYRAGQLIGEIPETVTVE